jgi:hypothetical protein
MHLLQYTVFTNKASECKGHLIRMQTSTLYFSAGNDRDYDSNSVHRPTMDAISTSESKTNGKERKRQEDMERREGGGGYARRRRSDSYASCGYRGKAPGSGEPGVYTCSPCPLDPASPTNSSGSSPDRKYRSISDGSNSEGGTGEGADVRGG